MKSFLNKIKTEKEKKNENIVEIIELEIELVKFKSSNNPNKLQSEIKELNKNQVVNENLHEIEQEILVDYTGDI